MSRQRRADGWYEHRPRRPGPGPRRAGRRAFGASWWGAAWVEALERRAQLDPNRLPRGRTYARTGAVGALSLVSGEVLAEVQGSRRSPYTVRVRVRVFDPGEWETVFDALAAEIGHSAALFDGELAPGVADDVASVGLDLLPGPGELQPRCSCPDFADPCKHAAAVCYLVADALDADPFGVLLLRGRGRDEVLAALRARRSAGRTDSVGAGLTIEEAPDEGMLARDAWSRELGRLPSLLPPRRAGHPTVLAVDPPSDAGIDTQALRGLAADAAARALGLLRGATSTGLELSAGEDLARRAAGMLGAEEGAPDSAGLAELARRANMPARELVRRALAYRAGGIGGLAVLDDAFDPDPAALRAGRDLLGPGATLRRNRVTLGDRQVRLGRDGSWYPLSKDRTGRWNLDGGPLPAIGSDEIGDLAEDAGT